ncbi:SH3 domain-containing protein [Microbacterium sp.]|uniref:SH3 domain-containing protein n=1 Tax=Microbacterium sp. TaxID=51671 RepID=UPI003A8B6B38
MSYLQGATTVDRRRVFRALRVTLVAAAVVSTGLFVAPPAPAAAAQSTATVITSGVNLNVRSGPGTKYSVVKSLAPGTRIGINCYRNGSSVTGPYGASTIWYSVEGVSNGWVTDAWIYTGSNNPVTSPCASSTTTRESKAYSWAAAQIGATSDPWGRAIDGWCARWSVGAYGQLNAGYASAYDMWLGFKSKGLTRTSGTAPKGTFVFFGKASVNGYYGHVAIATGDGRMITTGGKITVQPYSWANAPYLGWSYAPAGWTR